MNGKSNIFFLIFAIFLIITVFSGDSQIIFKVSLAASISGIFFTLSEFCLNYGCEIKMIFDTRGDVLQNNDIPFQQRKKYQGKYASICRVIIYGKIFFAIGIFSFLYIVTYYNEKSNLFLFQLLKNIESKMTIIAFSIIMLNYWLQDWYIEKQRKCILTLGQTEGQSNGQTEI